MQVIPPTRIHIYQYTSGNQEEQYQQEPQPRLQPNLPSPVAPHQPEISVQSQAVDILYPFFDPEMLNLFPNGEMPDLAQFETSPISLDYFEIEGWKKAPPVPMAQNDGENMAGTGVFGDSTTGAGLYCAD
jgi:hypothetical protein